MSRRGQEPARTEPKGVWLLASRVLRRAVLVGEPYPHICHGVAMGDSGVMVKIYPGSCAAPGHGDRPRKATKRKAA